MDITDPRVVIGAFLGAIVVVMAAAMTMSSVGKAAIDMVTEIRRQFREIPGLLQGMAQAGHGALRRHLDQRGAARNDRAGPDGGHRSGRRRPLHRARSALAGMLMGSTIVGVVLALFMANAGGAWDNAKKFIEGGQIPGEKKGSDAHAAAVDRRYGRRPVQGHLGPGDEHPDQAALDRLADHRAVHRIRSTVPAAGPSPPGWPLNALEPFRQRRQGVRWGKAAL